MFFRSSDCGQTRSRANITTLSAGRSAADGHVSAVVTPLGSLIALIPRGPSPSATQPVFNTLHLADRAAGPRDRHFPPTEAVTLVRPLPLGPGVRPARHRRNDLTLVDVRSRSLTPSPPPRPTPSQHPRPRPRRHHYPSLTTRQDTTRRRHPGLICRLGPMRNLGLDELNERAAMLTRVDRKYALDAATASVILSQAPRDALVPPKSPTRCPRAIRSILRHPRRMDSYLLTALKRRRFKVAPAPTCPPAPPSIEVSPETTRTDDRQKAYVDSAARGPGLLSRVSARSWSHEQG